MLSLSTKEIVIRNPFALDARGQEIYEDLLAIEDVDERKAKVKELSDEDGEAYRSFIRARDNRRIAKGVTGVTLVGGLVGTVLWALSSDDEGEEWTDDDDDDDEDNTESIE